MSFQSAWITSNFFLVDSGLVYFVGIWRKVFLSLPLSCMRHVGTFLHSLVTQLSELADDFVWHYGHLIEEWWEKAPTVAPKLAEASLSEFLLLVAHARELRLLSSCLRGARVCPWC